MKILFFINHLADGGAERVAATLLNHLCEKHEVKLVLFSEKKATYNIDDKITSLKIIVNGNNKLIKAIKRILKIRKLIKEINPDLMISFMTHTNIYVLIANAKIKRKIIVSERNTLNRVKPQFVRIIRRLIYPTANKIVFVTNYDREHSGLQQKSVAIYNPAAFEPCNFNNNRKKSIINITSFERWYNKGLDILIKAWAKISSQNPEWNLEIYGRNSNRIPAEIQQLQQERVSWFDWKDNLDEILREKSIFVLTSRYEGCPNSLIEAMSQGCACIATNCAGGMKEIIADGKDGLLTESENIDDIAQTIQLLIKDEVLQYKLSVGAIEKAKQFNKNTFFAKWDNLVAEVTAK